MKKITDAIKGNKAFWICLIVSIILIISGFICPPMGVIDNSVIISVGELFGFASLGAVYRAMEKGVDATITHGNTTVSIDNDAKDA